MNLRQNPFSTSTSSAMISRNENVRFRGTRFCKIALSLIPAWFALFAQTSPSPSQQEIQNLMAFAKLYGYVKYFHPSDEAAQIDWNRFAIYGAKKIKGARGDKELRQGLEELFKPIAPAIVIQEKKQKIEVPIVAPNDTTGLQVVAWQHLGLGLVRQNIYASRRLNRLTSVPSGSMGSMTAILDSLNYRGSKIKLRASVKAEVPDWNSQGELWLRVVRSNGDVAFFDRMEGRPITSPEWGSYEINGEIDDDVKQIYFGCMLLGSGKAWVDAIEVLIGEGEEWKSIPLKNPDFEQDEEGKPPSGWIARTPGYSFSVTSETSSKGRKSVVIKDEQPKPQTDLLFERIPSVGEYFTRNLGAGLSCDVPMALYSDTTGTIPRASRRDLEKLLSEMQSFERSRLTGDDMDTRIGDIIIAWNVFQHFYPYFDVVKVDWTKALQEGLRSAQKDMTRLDFLKTLQKMTAQLRDGHGWVALAGDTSKAYCLPIKWDWIESQVVITRVIDSSIKNVRVGDVVVRIDGVAANKVLGREEVFASGATPQSRRSMALNSLLFGGKNSKMNLTIRSRNSKPVSLDVERTMRWLAYVNVRDDAPKFEKIREGIYYLNLMKLEMTEIDSLLPELAKAKGIICDVRGYPKGNHDFISHLLPSKDTSKSWMRIPQIIFPDRQDIVGYKNLGWEKEAKKPHLNAKLVFMTDVRAVSYAESYMSFIEHYKLADIVGEPTAGTNGNVNVVNLPGGYSIRWTGMKVVKHDGSQHHGVGIQPTIPVTRTVKGVREGRDEFLEKAIEVIELKIN